MLMYTSTGQPVNLAADSTTTAATPTVPSVRYIPTTPWGTIALIAAGITAAGLAAWEIDAHQHRR